MNSLSSHRNFTYFLEILKTFMPDLSSIPQETPIGPLTIEELEKLYKEAFSTPKSKKLSKEVKNVFMVLIRILERMFKKAYLDFNDFEWGFLANLLPNFSVFELKYQIFQIQRTTIGETLGHSQWSQQWDELLIMILGTYYPMVFRPIGQEKVKWTIVARELCRRIDKIGMFKSDKQCKERWLNHLNPYLKRQSWTEDEDIQLILESIKLKTKWSLIAKNLIGRTQHAVKNRFIYVVNKTLELEKEKIREFIKKKEAWKLAELALEPLKAAKKVVQ